MGKRIKIIKVPGTTANIKRGIINFLNSRGHFAFPINNVGIWDEAAGSFRRNPHKGIADILCSFKYRKPITGVTGTMVFNVGVFLAIEVKNKETHDVLSDAQIDFMKSVKATSGLYLVVYDYDEFVQWYDLNYSEYDEPSVKRLPGKRGE
jgi:hypothetical protein